MRRPERRLVQGGVASRWEARAGASGSILSARRVYAGAGGGVLFRVCSELSDETSALAAFDLDGTLTRGGSVMAFLCRVAGLWPTTRAVATRSPSLAKSLVIRSTTDHAKEALFIRLLAGLEAAEVAEVAEDFARSYLEPRVRPEMVRVLEWHRDRGHRVVIVSASPALYVEPLGRSLGVDAVLATRLEVSPDGRLTGRFSGLNCRGDEKLARVLTWLDGAPAKLWAYGNSSGDAQLLAAADVGVRVRRRPLASLPEPVRSD